MPEDEDILAALQYESLKFESLDLAAKEKINALLRPFLQKYSSLIEQAAAVIKTDDTTGIATTILRCKQSSLDLVAHSSQ